MQSDLNVGAGLLANAVRQSIHLSLMHRIREQARSHSGPHAVLNMRSAADSHALKSCFSVGAGLPAMQAPRCVRHTELMLSQRCDDSTSQLPPLTEYGSAVAVAVAVAVALVLTSFSLAKSAVF